MSYINIMSQKELKRNLVLIGILLILTGIILLLPKAFSSPVPIKSVTITSEKLNYSKKDPGSFNIEKSAEWISKGKARITFDVDTVVKAEDKYRDIIFVLDISGSMNGDKLARVKQDSIDLINTLLSDSNNRGALITFETSSQLVLGLTNNKKELSNAINSLTTTGCTNYYQALVNVDKILKDYKKEENRDCIVLFLTDGYPNEDTPNEEGQYNYLKKQYPYVTINGIQYEMGSDVLDPIKKVSDQQFIADMTNLNNVLFVASVAPITYDSFSITDYINDDYFEIDSVDSIIPSVGITKLEYENSTPKVIWNIENLRSGSKATLTIDINLKKEFLNTGGVYPTNKKEEIKTEIDKVKEDITSPRTPVLADNYRVIYDGNVPEGCVAKNIPETTTRSVFETVEISNQGAACEGYQFKGWTIATENVKRIGDNHFIMPESDVMIKANWGKMNIAKSIDGEVFKVQTLYKIVAEQASLDNTKSKFVSSSSGIDFAKAPSDTNGKGVYTIASTKDSEYPVHYFRGEVTNNNVKFANICWKIVRTTETGGVKLIYNGLPTDEGGCTNTTGDATQIGTSAFNQNYTSPADVGYMYGARYTYSELFNSSLGSLSWYNYVGKTRLYQSGMNSTEYYYGDSVTYDGITNTYTLINAKKYLWNSDNNYMRLEGKYTCFKDTDEGCERIAIINVSGSTYTYYVPLINGETYEDLLEQAKKVKWIYGKDVKYVDGKYKLVDTVAASPVDWNTDYKTIVNAHKYTCHTVDDSCTNVRYVYSGSSSKAYYMTLEDGNNIDDILKEMTYESNNETSSIIKTKIDDWYSKSMTAYTKELEDTVWCNDRSVYQKNEWDKNSTSSDPLRFGAYGRTIATYSPSIECPNDSDKFTVNSANGNGKLTYPVALLTADEATLAGQVSSGYSNKSYLYTNKDWWLLSSFDFQETGSDYRASEFRVDYNGKLSNSFNQNTLYGVRPSVSLAPGTMVSDGNGSMVQPFEVFLPETD